MESAPFPPRGEGRGSLKSEADCASWARMRAAVAASRTPADCHRVSRDSMSGMMNCQHHRRVAGAGKGGVISQRRAAASLAGRALWLSESRKLVLCGRGLP